MRKKPDFSINFGRAIFAFAVIICLTNAFIGTARADEWRDHERGAHEWHKRHVHQHERPVIEEPNIVYAPPVIVETPPVIDMPLSGMNIIIPLNIR